MTTLTLDDKLFKLSPDVANASQFITEFISDDDGDGIVFDLDKGQPIPVMVGTVQDLQQAIHGLELLMTLVDLLDKFNHPVKGETTTEMLNEWKSKIATTYASWKPIAEKNETYHWLYPKNHLTGCVKKHESGCDAASFFQTTEIPDPSDYQRKFINSCHKGHEHLHVLQWLYGLGDVNVHTSNDYVFKHSPPHVLEWLLTLP